MSVRKHPRHTGYRSRAALVFLLLCVVAVGSLTAYVQIGTGQKRIMDQTATALMHMAQAKCSAIVSWYGGVESPLTAFSRQDVLKLFVDGVNGLDGGAAALLNERTTPDTPDIGDDDDDEPSRLRRQLPAIRALLAGQLSPFIPELDLLTPDLTSLAHADEHGGVTARALDPSARHAAEEALRSNALFISPARISPQGNTILTLVLPVQGYLETTRNRPEGLLVATLRLNRAVALATSPRGGEAPALATRLLSFTVPGDSPEGAFNLEQANAGSLVPLPDWHADAKGDMPFAGRSLPDNADVFSVGVRVPELPLAVGADILTSDVLETIRAHRDNVLLWTAALTLAACLLIGLLWWRLVGRHAEAMDRELEELHHTVTQQHELIANITEALSDGLVVQNRLGRVLYANSSFGHILGRSVTDLMGSAPESALLSVRGEVFDTRWREVLRLDQPVTYTLELASAADPAHPEKHGHKHFQIASEPFYDADGKVTGVVALCRDISDMIHAQERQQAMIWKTVNALSTSIEVVDPYLRGQSEHTGELALRMASLLDWDDARKDTLRIAASLSQLGMLRLPRGLAGKTGRLSPEERLQLQSHVTYAKEMLDDIDFGLPVVEVITQMYERMDGSGYPKGLKGDEIREEARLLAVANTYCALLRPRSYRQACGSVKALRILSEENTQYDERFVETLKSFLATEEGGAFTTKLCG